MKKAIFLVEDIKDGTIITLLENSYGKLIVKLNEEGLPFAWISEIARILNHLTSDQIIFKKATEFIEEIEDGKSIPQDTDIFYFISVWLHVATFKLTDFFLMDPKVTDFLVENQIPIIIDGSMEMTNISVSSYDLFENTKGTFIEKSRYYRDIHKLTFYIVGGSVEPGWGEELPRNVYVKHCFFPAAFFRISHPGSDVFVEAERCRDSLFTEIKRKQITNETQIWQAFCRTPRLTRILFQLWAEKEGLTNYGKFSRLQPCRDIFLKECARTGIFQRYQDRLSFVNKRVLKKLDRLHQIDLNIEKEKLSPDGLPFLNNSMFQIILETCPIKCGHTFNFTPLMLTEKTSMTILSGMPFITLGGHGIREILSYLGFKEYAGLELPDHRHQNFFEELDYVIEKVKKIIDLPLDQKQKLYESWKETIMFNYDLHLSLDPQRLYLEFLKNSHNSYHRAKAEAVSPELF